MAAGFTDIFKAFSAAVYQYPDRPAVIDNGRPVTYAELGMLVRAAAGRLGPRPGVVGVLTHRGPGTVVGLLGVLAAGGTYCPIDPAFPIDRQQAMLAAAGCDVVIAADPELAPPPGMRDLATAAAGASATGPAGVVIAPEDPAYILFTSGSTSEPKPVVTPHRAIAATVESLHGLLALTAADRVLQFASLNWDTCFEEILPALTAGAALVFDDAAHSGSFPRFLRMIAAEQVTVLDLPTAFWHELVRHLADDHDGLPACLRLVVIGGEPASAALLADWCDLDTAGIRLVNTYGCTETTLVTHAVDLHGPLAPGFALPWRQAARVPIGSALPHAQERISAGGELLIGGPSLALGYRGLPRATQARFEVDDGGARWFHTGDRVSRCADGLLTHQGRLDNEVKIRGIRVDPAEVEAHIAGQPGVAAVAVVGVSVAGRTTLAAHVVAGPRADRCTLEAEVLSYLRARVPAHLVPARVIVVPQLAYTASGKIDRLRSQQQAAAYHQIGEQLP